MTRQLLADIVLVLHFGLAAFIVLGLGLTWLGAARAWQWVRDFRFRLAHIAAITFVAIEALLGIACPLTVWEDALRRSTGEPGFVARWVRRLLYYDLPEWVFTSAYIATATATALTWWWLPPQRRRRDTSQ